MDTRAPEPLGSLHQNMLAQCTYKYLDPVEAAESVFETLGAEYSRDVPLNFTAWPRSRYSAQDRGQGRNTEALAGEGRLPCWQDPRS